MADANATLTSLDIEVTILQGRDLVAKDRKLFGLGKKGASDPFVKLYLGTKYHGRTETIEKTVNPTWRRNKFKISLNSKDANAVISGKKPEYSSLKLLIFDEDQLSDADPMGTVVIPLGPILTEPPEEKWYHVGKGSGLYQCHNATGDLKVKVAASGKKALNLIRGNVYKVPAGGKLRVGLGWQLEGGYSGRHKKHGKRRDTSAETDLDTSCVAVGYGGDILMDETVYYGDLENSNRSILHTGDEREGDEDIDGTGDDEVIMCNLDRVSPKVLALYFIATVATAGKTFANVTSALVRVTDMKTGTLMCKIAPSLAGESTALLLFRLSRDLSNAGGWVLSVIGDTHNTARDFGMLIPSIKGLTRDLVPHVSINPLERIALMSKGGAIRVRDFSGKSDGEDMPSKLTFGLAWDITNGRNIDLDASAICLDKSRKCVELIFFRNLRSANGSIRHGGDEREGDEKGDDEKIFLSLDNVPSEVAYIGFVINSYSGQELDDVSKASCHLYDTKEKKDFARYVMSHCKALDRHTALVLGCLYRDESNENDWCLWIIGEPAQGRTAHDNVDELQRALVNGPPKPKPPPEGPENYEDIVIPPMPDPVPVYEEDIIIEPMHEMGDIIVKF
mmetsp:Transcript_7384/g.11105  ORF Transcript_7384/g.11105 Transcript_7384/m.11105 type:complete len:620 (-) Transcript_7384:484-2343(-)